MIQEWLDALSVHGCEPKQRGDGWTALCPAHEDRNPSLSVGIGDNDRVLVRCHAGCNFSAIRAALGLVNVNGHKTPENAHQTPPQARQPKPPPKPQPLPTGENVTQYFYTAADGAMVFAVIRRDYADKPKRFSQWTPADAGQWLPVAPASPRPMYGLPTLGDSGKVAIVEGERCAHASREAWPKQVTVCWAGGTNAWQQTDWTPISGREVSLLSDGDKPGHKAMQTLAVHLAGLGCKIKIALPPVEWDSDVADWIAEGGRAAAAEIIGGLLEDYKPPADTPVADAEPVEPLDLLIETGLEEIRDNPHYRILGLVGTSVAVRLREAGVVFESPRKSFTERSTLVGIAPQIWWCGWAGIDKLTADESLKIGDTLIREADKLGQVDQSLFWGRGAVKLPDGKIGYHLGDRLLIDGAECDLDDENSLVWLAEPRIELAAECSARQAQAIARAVMSYRWETEDAGRRFLGWIVAAILGGALEWRPHLLMTAPSTQGKTWILKEVLEKIMGPLLTSISDATPAAISKLTAHASLPIAIDEAEPSEEWVLELLKTLRAASSDFGSRIRVAPGNNGVNFQQARFCALLAGTVAPALGRADDTRLTPVGFGPPVDDWRKVRLAIQTALQHAPGVRTRIIRRAAPVVAEANRLANEMQDLGMDSREALASAAFTAGWRFWGVDEKEVHSQPEPSTETDADSALLAILAIRHRDIGGKEESLGMMFSETHKADTLADLYGLRMVGDDLMVAFPHDGLKNAMFRTKWANADLRKLLMQLDGAVVTKNPFAFGPLRKRAVLIPPETLKAMGVEIAT